MVEQYECSVKIRNRWQWLWHSRQILCPVVSASNMDAGSYIGCYTSNQSLCLWPEYVTGWPKSLGHYIHMGDKKEAAGFQLWIISGPATLAVRGVNPADRRSLSMSRFQSVKSTFGIHADMMAQHFNCPPVALASHVGAGYSLDSFASDPAICSWPEKTAQDSSSLQASAPMQETKKNFLTVMWGVHQWIEEHTLSVSTSFSL